MKKNTRLFCAFTMAALIAAGFGCKKKDDAAAPSGSYVIALTADGSSSEATDYILQAKDLTSGTISPVGQGIEQKSYRMYEQVGKTLLSITYQGTNIVPGYSLDATGVLTQKSGEISIKQLHARGVIDENLMMGMYVPRNGTTKEANFYEIDATAMAVTKQVNINVFDVAGNGKEQAYFNALLLKKGKLYAPFFQIKNSSFETAYADSAYIAVFNYADMKLEKVIKDSRTGTVGAYATNDGIFQVENGDLYTFSPCAIASGVAPTNKPSAILRIKDGASEFDKDYFFNIEEVTGGYKIAAIQYIGNGKALADIYSFKDHVAADKWTGRDTKSAIIDLNAKTVNYVSGVPLHFTGLHYRNIIEGSIAHVQIKNNDGIFIYQIDLNSATATKGAQVLGKYVMGLFKMHQ